MVWYQLYCLKDAAFSIEGDSISYRRGKKLKRIRFADISRIRLSTLSTLSLYTITSKDTTIRFGGGVESSSEFLWNLKESLDREGRSDLYEQSKLLRNLKILSISDQRHKRFLRFPVKLLFLFSSAGTIGFILASLGRFSVEVRFLWAIFSIIWTGVVLNFLDVILMRPFKKLTQSDVLAFPLWNFGRQRIFYRGGGAVGTAIYLIAASLVLAPRLNDPSHLWERDMEKGWEAFQYEEYDKAEALFLEAIEITGAFESDDSRLADSLHNLGLVYKAQGMEREAELVFNRSLAVLRERGSSKARAESSRAKRAEAGGEE